MWVLRRVRIEVINTSKTDKCPVLWIFKGTKGT